MKRIILTGHARVSLLLAALRVLIDRATLVVAAVVSTGPGRNRSSQVRNSDVQDGPLVPPLYQGMSHSAQQQLADVA